MQAMPPPTAYHHQNRPASGDALLVHQPSLVPQPTPKPSPVPNRPVSDTPPLATQPTLTTTTTMTTSETTTNTTPSKPPPPVPSAPEKTNQPATIPITMQECKDFFDSEMAVFRARLKKQTNMSTPSATNSQVTRPTTTRPPPAPSPTVTSSEDFTEQLAVLQANLTKHFPQDMADSHATKHTCSAAKSNTIHPQLDCTDTIAPTPIAPSKRRAVCTADKMEKLKKSLKRPVRTNRISTRHFFQTYVTPIVHRSSISEELKQRRRQILVRQRKNVVTKTENANEKAQNVKATAADRTHHHLENMHEREAPFQ